MMSLKDVEELLPSPIKIEICCDPNDFKMVVQDSFNEVLKNHNRNYDTKIENIRRNYVNEYGDEDFSMLEHNECRVFVGNKIVQYTKCPDIYTTDLSVEIPQSISDYYMSIVPITEQILNIWHDKIVEIQDENNKKLENYKLDGYDELIFAYYSINSDDRAFQYLKKLATRYPNSNYNNRLRRVYRNGLYGHRRNKKLACKINKRKTNAIKNNF